MWKPDGRDHVLTMSLEATYRGRPRPGLEIPIAGGSSRWRGKRWKKPRFGVPEIRSQVGGAGGGNQPLGSSGCHYLHTCPLLENYNTFIW